MASTRRRNQSGVQVAVMPAPFRQNPADSTQGLSREISILLFGAAVIAGTFRFLHGGEFPTIQLSEPYAVARNLALDGSFSNPFFDNPTGATAHVAPLYPLFLALLIRTLGNYLSVPLMAAVLTILAHGLHAVLLPRASKLLLDDARPGLYGAWLSIVLPTWKVLPSFDEPFAAVGLILFCLGSQPLLNAGSPLRLASVGLFAGLLALLNPATICVSVPWVLVCLRALPRASAFARSALIFLLGVGVICLPWAVRNYTRLAGVFFLRDNLGLELYVSNNDCASASMVRNLESGCLALRHPSLNRQEAVEVRRLGEARYNRSRLALALRWIRSHPERFLRLTMQRMLQFWFPDPAGLEGYAWSVWILTALSIPGLVFLRRSAGGGFLFLSAVLAIYPVPYYFVQSFLRYRYPILWLSLILAGYTISTASRCRRWRGLLISLAGIQR